MSDVERMAAFIAVSALLTGTTFFVVETIVNMVTTAQAPAGDSEEEEES